MAMNKNRLQKHNIDIMFLMILFLIFTFSAVSVLLLAVNSYKAVVVANEENSNTRAATAYIREKVRQHDESGSIEIAEIDGNKAIKMKEAEGYYLYIYYLDGYLMELETKEGAGVTADFGNQLLKINGMDFSWKNNQLMEVQVEETTGEKRIVDIGIKSAINYTEKTSDTEEDSGEEVPDAD
ncbi:protein of unknown function [Pseudobutyrivibrio sp. 49]|nr:protein of unknown function [Pseudobutyrivibrio sp. 49]